MSIAARTKATIDDLYGVSENAKAELINGELITMSPTGGLPGRTASKITSSLLDYEQVTGSGYAFGDNVGFVVDLPNRQSFSPDAAYYFGAEPDMKFVRGAPVFAVEVRSEADYGATAEQAMRDKRADYFAAGSQVVWDVDLLGDDFIRSYRSPDPETPAHVFRRGDTAHAEPILPGWRFNVDNLFPKLCS